MANRPQGSETRYQILRLQLLAQKRPHSPSDGRLHQQYVRTRTRRIRVIAQQSRIGRRKLQTRRSWGGEERGWSGEASRAGGFRVDDQKVNITFGEAADQTEKRKEVPIWITESTVNTAGGGGVNAGSDNENSNMSAAELPSASGPLATITDDDEDDVQQNDEITSLLIRHEKRPAAQGGKCYDVQQRVSFPSTLKYDFSQVAIILINMQDCLFVQCQFKNSPCIFWQK